MRDGLSVYYVHFNRLASLCQVLVAPRGVEPLSSTLKAWSPSPLDEDALVGHEGVEPSAPAMSRQCSNR